MQIQFGDDLNEGIQAASDGMIATECRIFVDVHTLVVIIWVSRIFDFHFSFFQTYLSRWYWPKLFISSLTRAWEVFHEHVISLITSLSIIVKVVCTVYPKKELQNILQ